MSEADIRRPAFTLRFTNEATHRNLRHTAQALGISMNELAEVAIEHELAVVGADLEQKLTRAAELLRSYREDGTEKDLDAFARAEVTIEDPLLSHGSSLEDTYGVGALFARSMER